MKLSGGCCIYEDLIYSSLRGPPARVETRHGGFAFAGSRSGEVCSLLRPMEKLAAAKARDATTQSSVAQDLPKRQARAWRSFGHKKKPTETW